MKRSFILLIVWLPFVGLTILMQAMHSYAIPSQIEGDGSFTVNSTADATDVNPGDGICETAVDNNICTLRAAIQETNALAGANEIQLPAGIYTLTLVGFDSNAAAGDLDIIDDLVISGEGKSNTIVDGNQLDRVFDIPSGTFEVLFRDLSIQNGRTSSWGGGICNCTDNAKLVLERIEVKNNNAQNSGGGIQNDGILEISNSIIRENGGRFVGGGIKNDGSANISQTVVISNSSSGDGLGGGIYNGGVMIVKNSTIRGNAVMMMDMGSNGGGIFNGGTEADITIENSTISQNSAQPSYGGFVNYQGTSRLINSTISENTQGGVLQMNSGTIFITNTSIISNVHDKIDPVWDVSLRVMNGSVTLANTIVAGDTSENNCIGVVDSVGHNLESGNSCNLNSTGDISGTNPLVGPLQWNGGDTSTYALLAGSPAIDAGNNSTCSTTDQRGAPRPIGALCDIGAFEYSSGPIAVDDEVADPSNLPLLIDVLANDLPSENGAPVLTDVGVPLDGSAVIIGTAVYYTPTMNYVGEDVFSYTISDGILTDTGTITVIVGTPPEYTIYLPMVLKSQD